MVNNKHEERFENMNILSCLVNTSKISQDTFFENPMNLQIACHVYEVFYSTHI